MSRSRNWCFTINNPTNEEIELCDNIACNYIIFAYETGDKGTGHIQGYIELENAKSLKSIKKNLGGRGHFESRKGTPKQASDYCKKDGLFIEKGTLSNQGKRSDLDEIAEIVKNEGIKGVIEKQPGHFIKFGRNIERLAELYMTARTTKPYVVWLYGKSGVGKTKEAANCPDYYIWNQTKWWNGYKQQKRIIIDDYAFDESEQHFRYILKLLDRYSIQVETKGGMIYLNSPEIYITCEHPPQHFWKPGNELDQILRRIDKVEEIKYKKDNNLNEYQVTPQEQEPEDNIHEDDDLADI